MGISIIIIHFNNNNLTIKCIESIKAHIDIHPYELIIIDNGSNKPFELPNPLNNDLIKISYLNNNIGYAGAVNEGIKLSKYNYFLFINNDIEFHRSGLKSCVELMESNKTLGALGCKLLYPDLSVQPSANKFPSIRKELIEMFRLQKFNKKGTWLLGGYFDQSTSLNPDWIWGTFFLSKKETILKLPGKKLNDDYFMYYEDVAWGEQIKKSGLKILYNAEYSIIHHLSVSSNEFMGSMTKWNAMIKNENDFIKKKHGNLYAFFLYLARSINLWSHPTKNNLLLGVEYFLIAFRGTK